MPHIRTLLAFALVLSAVPLLTPSVVTQTMTTYTGFTTITFQLTVTSTNRSFISTQTMSKTNIENGTIYSDVFSLRPSIDEIITLDPLAHICIYYNLGFEFTKGDKVTGSVSTNGAPNFLFYIMTQEALGRWTSAGRCQVGNYVLIGHVPPSAPYTFAWSPSSSGMYWFLFVSYDFFPAVHFEANRRYVTTRTLTSTEVSTLVQTLVQESRTTSNWLQVTEVELARATPSPSLLIVIIISVGVCILFALSLRRRHKKPSEPT